MTGVPVGADTESTDKHVRSLMIVSGDHSGEKHASKIIRELKERDPDLQIWGVGGSEMEKAGMELLFNSADYTVVGIFEVKDYVWFFAKMHWTLLANVIKRNPDAILLVDFGGFNVGFAQSVRSIMPVIPGDTTNIDDDHSLAALICKPKDYLQKCFDDLVRYLGFKYYLKWQGVRKSKRAVPIYYFISPQVWASRPWRIKALKRSITKIFTIFPFEEGVYLQKNVNARFVGNPLLRALPELETIPDREAMCLSLNLDSSKPIIVVMPGSRKQEVIAHMPVLEHAMKTILDIRPDTQFVICRATDYLATLIDASLKASGLDQMIGKGLTVLDSDRNFELMKNCDLIWAKSGTTTLETALFGKPMIIFYMGNWFSYLLVMLFKSVKNFGWPNLLAGHQLVPELIQLDCRGEMLVKYTLDMLDVPGLRQEITSELLTLRAELGQGDFVENCAEELLQVVQ